MQDSIIFIDFEGSKTLGVLEYGLVHCHGTNIVETNSDLCSSEQILQYRDTQLHGIANEDIHKKSLFTSHWELFAKSRESSIFVAHNASVENNFLKWTWPHPRLSINPLNKENQSQSWGPWIDTLNLYKKYYPKLETYKLRDLIQIFNLQEKLMDLGITFCPKTRCKYHCALYDCLASYCLLNNLILTVYKNYSVKQMLIDSQPPKMQMESWQQTFPF
tara:strand:- start:3708 stop:4361 length:654 start_codon:yes stop_codon:yes gene_type:complete